jgi:predicted DsbA family dithiol-disulfide isomerase
VLTKLAGEVGLDQKEFEEAVRNRKYREAQQQALRHGYVQAHIEAVPAFFIGKQILAGLQCKEVLEAVIEEELKSQENSTAR